MKNNDSKTRHKKYNISSSEIKLKENELKENTDRKQTNEEDEIYDLIKSSALLKGLDISKSDWKIKPIANWKFPKIFKKLSELQISEIRKKFKIEIEGNDLIPPISIFEAMKFPKPVLKALNDKKIYNPTPIQMQGFPVVLSGRDMISIAFTGSGKTLLFVLPALMMALEEERKLRISNNEGPFSMIIVPSRELAIQIHELIYHFIKFFLKYNYPLIRSILCIGGVDVKNQIEDIQKGLHIVVGTPGRLSDLLDKKKLDVSMCRFLVLDEADRLLDMGFDEEIRRVMEHFKKSRQTLLFSSTMPKKIQEFAMKCLFNPLVINVGRAGSANLNVNQEVEYVKEESKLIQLLETLQKTPPPVLIFCENKNDVDEIHEYLLLKGIEVVSIHGDKDQDERNHAIREFKEGIKDVLVATDIVSKGLDFPNIEHVINYDMPKEIENYVLRIGRTGRWGKLGLATTYVNRNQDEAILLDLKHLLVEAGQKIPSFLSSIHEEDPSFSTQECSFCGGLGHKLNQCHKLENQRIKSFNLKLMKTNK